MNNASRCAARNSSVWLQSLFLSDQWVAITPWWVTAPVTRVTSCRVSTFINRLLAAWNVLVEDRRLTDLLTVTDAVCFAESYTILNLANVSIFYVFSLFPCFCTVLYFIQMIIKVWKCEWFKKVAFGCGSAHVGCLTAVSWRKRRKTSLFLFLLHMMRYKLQYQMSHW